jgi:putative intracellular protease/amidase
MKLKARSVFLGALVCFLAALCAAAPYARAEQGRKVLLIINDYKSADLELMLTKEAGVMKDLLSQAGFQVIAATVSGQPIVAGSTTFKPDLKLSEVKGSDYAGFIIPCMASEEEDPGLLRDAIPIIKSAVAEGKPVAAELGSVVILAKAGVLSGKKYAFQKEFVETEPALKDAIYSGDSVVQDGKIITSGVCPYMAKEKGIQDTTAALTKALIAELTAK